MVVLRYVLLALGVGALLYGLAVPAAVAFFFVFLDAVYLSPEVDAADAAVAAAGVEGDDGKQADGCFSVPMIIIGLVFLAAGIAYAMGG